MHRPAPARHNERGVRGRGRKVKSESGGDRSMAGESRRNSGPAAGDPAARAKAPSPRRLMLLTGAFLAALTVLVGLQMREEANSRRAETALLADKAASDCASAVNMAIMTGDSVRQSLVGCHPGGRAALYHLSANGDVLTAYGATRGVDLDPANARALPLEGRGAGVLDLKTGKAALSWRELDNGETVVAAAPAGDIYARTPVWVGYVLILAAISLVTASLMAAFLRQSRLAAETGGMLRTLREQAEALSAGRCCPWRFDSKERTVLMSRSLLEPLGLGARDRLFTLGEISALVHAEDLRLALAVFTGDAPGVSEGAVRFRTTGGAWSRLYLRTTPQAGRLRRVGVAFDLSGARMTTPTTAIAESRLKDAIESIPEAFVLWDAQGRLAAWNRRFASIFRFSERTLQPGLTSAEVATLAGARGDVVTEYFAPDAPVDRQSVEVALPADRWIHVSRRRTAEGGVVCIASGVTELKRRARAQKRRERELKQLVDALEASRAELSETMQKYELEKHRAEEANRSKSEFLANMSHELRTPLNAIIGFSEIMLAELYGPIGDARYKGYIADILSSGRHLLELIDDVLDMSKIEAGKVELEPRRVELERVLAESVRLVVKRAADSGVKLTASIAHAPAVWADPRAVKQVTLNLLSNAIKFTPPGGEVTVTAEADLDGVTVIVADSGTGIDRERLQKLGAPFELAGDLFAKGRQGFGLGLALSRSLMELQGGILAIASQPGKGTVACASFPRRKDARARLPHFMRKDAQILTQPPQRPEAAARAAQEAAE
jgi:two-component system cell cycle sensor histidine kinase PleC